MRLSDAIRHGSKTVGRTEAGGVFPLNDFFMMACHGAGIKPSMTEVAGTWPWIFEAKLTCPCDCKEKQNEVMNLSAATGHLSREHPSDWTIEMVINWVAEIEKRHAPVQDKPTTESAKPGRIPDLRDWFKSSNGLIVIGVGVLLAGLKGFQPSEFLNWLSRSWYTPEADSNSYQAIAVSTIGAMMITAGILKRQAHRQGQ